jgi:hypothetical protein
MARREIKPLKKPKMDPTAVKDPDPLDEVEPAHNPVDARYRIATESIPRKPRD